MRKQKIIRITLGIMLISGLSPDHSLFARNPDDPERLDKLFHIERSRDEDIVQYALNLDKDGQLIKNNPIQVYWVRLSEDGRKEPLTPIQKNKGYGVNLVYQDQELIQFHLVSFQDQLFTLKANSSGKYILLTSYGEDLITLTKLYIQFKGNSFLFPVIQRIDLFTENQYGYEYKLTSYYPSKRKKS